MTHYMTQRGEKNPTFIRIFSQKSGNFALPNNILFGTRKE